MYPASPAVLRGSCSHREWRLCDPASARFLFRPERCAVGKVASGADLHQDEVISSGRTARFSAMERYSANITCSVRRLSRPLVSGSEPLSMARMSDAIGPTNASGIHMLSRRAENQYPGLRFDMNSRVSGRPVG